MIWKEYGAEGRQAVAAADYADEEAHASLVLGRGPCPVIVTYLPFHTTVVYTYLAMDIPQRTTRNPVDLVILVFQEIFTIWPIYFCIVCKCLKCQPEKEQRQLVLCLDFLYM